MASTKEQILNYPLRENANTGSRPAVGVYTPAPSSPPSPTAGGDGGNTFTASEIDAQNDNPKPGPIVEPGKNATTVDNAGGVNWNTAAQQTRQAQQERQQKEERDRKDQELIDTITGRATPYASQKKPSGEYDWDDAKWKEMQQKANEDLLAALEEYSAGSKQTLEDLEKQKKKEKRDKIFAAISDGISSIGNLVATTKGGLDVFDPKKSMSEGAKKRYDDIDDKIDANRKRLLELAKMRYGTITDNIKSYREYNKFQAQMQAQAEKAANEAKIAEARAKVYENQGKYYEAQAARQEAMKKAEEAKAAEAQAKAEWAPKVQKSIVDKNEGSAAHSRASADASSALADQRRSGGGSGGGRGGGSRERYYGTINGKNYTTKADYDAAAIKQAKRLGIATETVTNAGKRTEKRTPRKINDVVADIEKKANSNEGYKL